MVTSPVFLIQALTVHLGNIIIILRRPPATRLLQI